MTVVHLPWFRHFSGLLFIIPSLMKGRRRAICIGRHVLHHLGEIMESSVQKACWGLTFRMVLGFAGFLGLVYLFGGN
jgi:hypothetical protein